MNIEQDFLYFPIVHPHYPTFFKFFSSFAMKFGRQVAGRVCINPRKNHCKRRVNPIEKGSPQVWQIHLLAPSTAQQQDRKMVFVSEWWGNVLAIMCKRNGIFIWQCRREINFLLSGQQEKVKRLIAAGKFLVTFGQ